ncbi:MAG: enoyl-CoA hydratase-related protein [Rhodobacteraceae bacterium]|nr:enoyl-CoA hydratase-related protein [Paracoccaceae bacterium]
MNYETLKHSIEDEVVIIRLNRPESRNAINRKMRIELTHAFRESKKLGKVLVLTGEGRAFCSGQDIGDGKSLANVDLEETLREEYYPLFKAITDMEIPSIAAVNGSAAGAGANLALMMDIVIASENAYFLQAFSRIGLLPDAGGTWVLPRTIGLAKTMGAALFAERISASDASNMGMIWEAVPNNNFDAIWRARAQQLVAGPNLAFQKLKEALKESYGNDLERQFEVEAKLQGILGRSRDFREGILAFEQKRLPKFEGR